MRIYAKCPPNMWDEFYMTAGHLQNKTTTRSLEGTTPWEQWYGRKPDYSYMPEIGCKVFVLIQNKRNPKIYERSLKCVLIGYDNDSKTTDATIARQNKFLALIMSNFWRAATVTHLLLQRPQQRPQLLNP